MYLVPSKEKLLEFLRSSQLFEGLSLAALEGILEDFELVHIEGQRTLIYEGDIGKNWFFDTYFSVIV